MGNSQSQPTPTAALPQPFLRDPKRMSRMSQATQVVAKRQSMAFSGLTLGCTSAAPHFDDDASQDGSETSSHTLEPPPPLYAATSELQEDDEKAALAFKEFLKTYPEYKLTWTLDALRRSDFSRLDRSGETYVDYMGASLYPESLIRVHTDFLRRSVLGNTHSVNNSSQLSSRYTEEARQAVLSFFRAPPGYTVVFTANATAALKLVGEAFPFQEGSTYVLSADSHNSVHGIRVYAANKKSEVVYIPCLDQGGVDTKTAMDILATHRAPGDTAPALLALTAQSNVTNSKNNLGLVKHAKQLGYSVLLDAAALAATSVINLADYPVDAMALSFYKLFGFPTGVGALVVKESFLAELSRPWFAGGTVDLVQAPGMVHRLSDDMHSRFEDGTINFVSLPAITDGLRFLSAYLPFLPIRLAALTHFLATSLSEITHENTDKPVVRVLSRLPTRRPKAVGEQAETGSVISLIFLDPSGEMLPLSFVEYAATTQNISLRTGCMCNPGGAAALLGLRAEMDQLTCAHTLADFEVHVGRELGVVRMSLGLASNFHDVYRVLAFARAVGTAETRAAMWDAWSAARAAGHGGKH
ncbi:PLP-dependent transferase [Phanerochaete sordida]|uniref:PLP-dependent transferase n=1 Tax=Phanerochaete sordida TaxID=48140 RepID=A0A9P3LKC2_9APHY|nr:PLP-dependent transferase [Phanerochaete sordida]